MTTRVAVVGAGYFSQFHYDAWSRIDGADVVALAAPEDGGGPEMAARWGIPAAHHDPAEMVDAHRPDLIDIVAPPTAHSEVIAAIRGRVPWIICQKPFCRDLAEARAAVVAAEAAGSRLAVHENVRFQPWYREIRRRLDAGDIGAPWQVTFRLRPGDGQGPRAYLDRQPYFQAMPRFLVHETAIHWIDTFRFLMGEVEAVSADLRRLNPAIAGEDAGTIQFAFTGGARGLFDGNRLSDHAATNRRLTMGEMDIEGPGGTIRLDGEARLTLRAHGSNDWRPIDYEWSDHAFGGDCVRATCEAILTAFRDGRPAETEARAYLRNLELEDAIYRSDEERCWIDV